MSTAFCLALLVATSAPQPAAEGSPPEEGPTDDTPAPGPAEDSDEPPAQTAPDDEADALASPDSASDDGSEPPSSDKGSEQGVEADEDDDDDRDVDGDATAGESRSDPAEPADDAPAPQAAPTDESEPLAPGREPAQQPPPPAGAAAPDDDSLKRSPDPEGDGSRRASTSRRPAGDDEDLLGDDRPVTSTLAVTAQVATGVAACCCGLPLAGLVGGPFNLIPFAGPFIGPCVMQTGFCAITAIAGGGAEVFVGDALGPGHGALLPVIGAQAVAHLAASLVGTVVGFGALGVAVGLALPNLPADPIQQGAYLVNDPGVIVASFITSAVFIAAIAASLALGPIAYALTAVPKQKQGFAMPRLVGAEQPPPPARIAHVRY